MAKSKGKKPAKGGAGKVDDPEIDNITAEDLLGDYPAVRYTPPTGSFYIDILMRLGEAFAFADLETERVPYGTLTVTVVTPRMLVNGTRCGRPFFATDQG